MHNKGIVRGALLGFVNPLDGGTASCIGAETVDSLCRKREGNVGIAKLRSCFEEMNAIRVRTVNFEIPVIEERVAGGMKDDAAHTSWTDG